MMEIPEAPVLARQLNETIQGKVIKDAKAGIVPHGFAFYHGDPAAYGGLLNGKRVGKARAIGGYVEIEVEDATLVLGEGVVVRLYAPGEKAAGKQMMRIELKNGYVLGCGVQMYGGMWAAPKGEFDTPYTLVAKQKPSPLSDAFDEMYFEKLLKEAKPTLSAKAFLATEQRIPGLGNGVLQDILFNARVNPKRKLETLSKKETEALFESIKSTLAAMEKQGGRDIEKDLFGNPGGYETMLCAKTWKTPCPICGGAIQKQAYMGGSVYFCPVCQPL